MKFLPYLLVLVLISVVGYAARDVVVPVNDRGDAFNVGLAVVLVGFGIVLGEFTWRHERRWFV